ncbi:MAG TPA: amidohydrolase family protein [Acidimicrobiales bacterium]|nr:amidohydrolase family protein [Acidimicrobiales bacterium]
MTDGSLIISNVEVFDGERADLVLADVWVEGEQISAICAPGSRAADGAAVVDGSGAVLMPGLVESHAHLSFGATVDRPENCHKLPVEDRLARCLRAGRVLLEAGFTSAYSGGNRIPYHDVLCREEFGGGWFPGPRLRAASWEGSPHMLVSEDEVDLTPADLTRFVNEMADLGVDIIKLSLSGESGVVPYTSRNVVFGEDEVAAAAAAARERGLWLSAHAHAAEAIKRAVRHGFRVIYHCTWADEEALEMIEAARDRIFVGPAPGINWANLNEPNALPSTEQEETVEQVKIVMPELRRRGVRVLPGGDYGFFWNPIGRNARDLRLFVEWFGFTPFEALRAATKWGGELMDLPVGLVREGYLADLLLVEGNPLEDVTVLEDPANISLIVKGGRVCKTPLGRLAAKAAV